jgi:hypothetical protein
MSAEVIVQRQQFVDRCDQAFAFAHPFLDDRMVMEYFYESHFYERDSLNERMRTQGLQSLKELK